MYKIINSKPSGRTDMLTNIFCLYGEITDDIAQEITEWILFNNYQVAEERPEELTLIVNSTGGLLSAAWVIIDFMIGSDIPVKTIGVGEIASAGLLIVMSGEVGMRILSENASIMSHQFSGGSTDKYHELISIQREYENTQKRLIKHISKCTGLNKRQIENKLMPHSDIYLTAKEAIKLGLADKVQKLK
jgi:ATP-dependent Clp protease protease subunit